MEKDRDITPGEKTVKVGDKGRGVISEGTIDGTLLFQADLSNP